MKQHPISSPPGFTSLGCLGYIAVLGLLIVGGQGVYVALKNPKPLELTVADYIAQKPNAEWVKLSDAQVSLVEAAYKARVGKVSEIFIPVRPNGESMDAPIHIVLSTEDKAVVAALQKLSRSDGTLKKKVDAASQQAEKLFMWQDIYGLTRYGIFFDLLMRARLARLKLNLAEDFVIVNDGEAPDLVFNLSLLGGGLLIWFFMLCHTMRNTLWRWRRRRAFYRARSEK